MTRGAASGDSSANGPSRPWTPEEDALARDWYAAGRSPAFIAAELGRTSSAVRMHLSRLGVRRPGGGGSSTNPPRRSGPRAPDDIASRMAALSGEIPLPPVRRMEIADADLLRYKGSGEWSQGTLDGLQATIGKWLLETPSVVDRDVLAHVLGLRAFASEVCRLELDDPQLAMAAAVLGAKRSVILAGRRSGKSHALGAVATWAAVCVPNSHVVIVAAADRQAKEVAERVVMPMFAQDDRLFASIRTSNKEVMELKNGSLVRFYPATGQIRGVGASLLLVDEARDILGEDLVYSSIEPMLANSNGTLALFSSPWMASGKLWDAWHSPFYAKVRVPSRASRFVSEEYVEAQRLTMSREVFESEYDAQFMENVAGYLSPEAIRNCLRDYGLREIREDGRTYALGVDFGRFRDASVFLVASRGEDDRLRVDWIRAFVNVPLSEQRPYAKYLDGTFRFARAVLEAAGLGIQISEEIARDLPGRVELFKPTITEKARAFEHLKGVMERGEIEIPYDSAQLLAQIRSLEFEVTASGIKIHGAHGSADDHVHALAYAAWGLRGRPGGGPGAARIVLRPSRRADPFESRTAGDPHGARGGPIG